jgi:hypothetical protein
MANTQEIKAGIYVGKVEGYMGIFHLEVLDSTQARFINLVTLHLPPAELENIDLTLQYLPKNDTVEISPAPLSIEPYIIKKSEDTLIMIQKPDLNKVILSLVKD